MPLKLKWMDYIATLHLFYIYFKCSESQSVGATVERSLYYTDDSICHLPQAGPFVWLNKSMATGNFSQRIYQGCHLCYRSKTEDQLIT